MASIAIKKHIKQIKIIKTLAIFILFDDVFQIIKLVASQKIFEKIN